MLHLERFGAAITSDLLSIASTNPFMHTPGYFHELSLSNTTITEAHPLRFTCWSSLNRVSADKKPHFIFCIQPWTFLTGRRCRDENLLVDCFPPILF
jgi:hypothetical protein